MVILMLLLIAGTFGLQALHDKAYPLEIIDGFAKLYKLFDGIVLVLAVLIFVFSDRTFDASWPFWGIFLASLIVQQEILRDMRRYSAEYIIEMAKTAVFSPEIEFDGVVLGKINFAGDEQDYLAAYIGNKLPDMDCTYEGIYLYISYDRRGYPKDLFCTMDLESGTD